jgi:hypothetical protein
LILNLCYYHRSSIVQSGECIETAGRCLDLSHLSADYRSGITAVNEIQPLLGDIVQSPNEDLMQLGRRNNQLAAVPSFRDRHSVEEMGCPGILVGLIKGSDGITRRKFKGRAKNKHRMTSSNESQRTLIGTQNDLDPTRDDHVAISAVTKEGHIAEMHVAEKDLPNYTSKITAEAIGALDDDFDADATTQIAEEAQIVKAEHPEAYLAGKPPNELVHRRQQMAREGKPFRYAVRFRIGPLGISFNNKVWIQMRSVTALTSCKQIAHDYHILCLALSDNFSRFASDSIESDMPFFFISQIPDSTVIERVVAGMQSALSDIMVSYLPASYHFYHCTARLY